MNKYAVPSNQHIIIAHTNFSFYSASKELSLFNNNDSTAALKVTTIANSNITVNIKQWDADARVLCIDEPEIDVKIKRNITKKRFPKAQTKKS